MRPEANRNYLAQPARLKLQRPDGEQIDAERLGDLEVEHAIVSNDIWDIK